MRYIAWTDDLPEREQVRAPNAAAAAAVYSMARIDDIDGITIHVEDPDGRVRDFVVVNGVATLQE